MEIDDGESVQDAVPQAAEQEPSLRDEISDAIEDLESGADKAPEPVEQGEAGEKVDGESKKSRVEQRRDEEGKFAEGKVRRRVRGEQPPQVAAPPAQKPPPVAAPDRRGQQQQAAVPPVAKRQPPRSLNAAEREVWSKLPQEAQDIFDRRERETAQAFEERAQAGRILQRVGATIAPYEAMIRAEQGAAGIDYDPLRVVGGLLATAAALRTGAPGSRVALVADIIRDYAVDLNMLNDELIARAEGRGSPGAQPQGAPSQLYDPRVDQLISHLQERESRAEQAEQERYNRGVESFGAGKEFFDLVRNDMADLVRAAARRGVDLSLEQAYEKACKLNPDVSAVVEQRAEVERVRNARASTARAQRAASVVSSHPVGVPGQRRERSEGGTLRDDISDAIDEVEEASD